MTSPEVGSEGAQAQPEVPDSEDASDDAAPVEAAIRAERAEAAMQTRFEEARVRLEGNVRDALAALPAHFASQTFIEGLEAGDLFSLNSMLGGNIEVQVVQTLNRLRAVWDPDEEWEEYRFVRSAQTFPDVRLETESPSRVGRGEAVAIGIELKGWYLLSKEGEPSFRYTVTLEACDERDLLCVVPWHLANVLAGRPVVYPPFVMSARAAVEARNHYWTRHRREVDVAAAAKAVADGRDPVVRASTYYDIQSPSGTAVRPYPPAKAKVSDKAAHDSGSNFGRVARTKGMMDDYVKDVLGHRVSGIEARHWVAFFKTYAEGSSQDDLHEKVLRHLALRRAQDETDDDLKSLLLRWAHGQDAN